MNKIESYLKQSGYNKFIKTEDLFKIDVKKMKGITFSELNDNIRFYILIEGYIDAYYPDKLGKSHLAGRIYSKDYQIGGLPGYFGRRYNNLNNYYISFSKNSLLYGINHEKMKYLIEDKDFLKFLLDKNIEFLSKVIQENYLRTVFNSEEYIAYILYHHSQDGQYIVENYFKFSNLVKCNRSTLYKVLSELEKDGIIEKNGKVIRIKSMEELKYIFEEKSYMDLS